MILKKQKSVIQVESFSLHVHFICVGPNCQRNIRKTHSVIRALQFDLHQKMIMSIYTVHTQFSHTSLHNDLGRLFVRHCVLVPLFLRVVGLPATGGEDVLVPLIPGPQTDLAGVRLVLLHRGVVHQPHVLVHVKLEERAALAPRLGDDEVVEGVVVWDDEVLFDVHELVHTGRLQLVKLLQQSSNGPSNNLPTQIIGLTKMRLSEMNLSIQFNRRFSSSELPLTHHRKVGNSKMSRYRINKNDVMRLGERPRSLEGKPDHLDLPFAINLYYSMSTISYGKALTIRLSKRLGAAMTARSFRFNIRVSVLS